MGACDGSRRVELGRAYHKLGRREDAWRELEAAVTLDVEDINAHLQKVGRTPRPQHLLFLDGLHQCCQ